MSDFLSSLVALALFDLAKWVSRRFFGRKADEADRDAPPPKAP